MTMPPELSPMLCTPDTDVRIGDEWVMEPKFDGWRGICLTTDTGARVFGGRNGGEYTGKAEYIEAELAACLPPGTAVDGELIAPAGWGSVQGAMTRGVTHGTDLTFVVFDVLQVRGNDMRHLPWSARRDILEMIEWQEHVCLTPCGDASPEAHQEFLDLGMEGSVCKLRTSRYSNGRSRDWIKVKLVETTDAKIVGFKPGNGDFAGLIGALEVELPDGTRTHASGMTRQVREHMTANFDREYLGKTVEVEHNGVLTSGKVRHPRFIRMRDDKDPVPAPARPKQQRAPRSGPWMRNYGAMGPDKLLASLTSLRAGHGDAYMRVINKGGSIVDHIAAAEKACVDKGLLVR